jgi:hypothetical protein
MPALRIHAGARARQHIARQGLQPGDIAVVPGAAGGPKGLVLGPLDCFVFGEWLARSQQPVHLVGASIGAWRLATACLRDPAAEFERLEREYIAQHFEPEPGRKVASAARVSEQFRRNVESVYGARVAEVLQHPRYRLHIVTSRGRHLLGREHPWRTPLGYLGAFLANGVHRKALGGWLERVVFSTGAGEGPCALPFATADYRTRQVTLTQDNFSAALQASCSVPFALKAVHDIPGAPRGAYWDGGITDYHLHLDYDAMGPDQGLVLYPHFQQAVVPGWLDKSLRWRHGATRFLDSTIVLAPDPAWIARLPNGKLPDRGDFLRYGNDLPGRMKAWQAAANASRQLADEFAEWTAMEPERQLARIEPLR